MKACQALPFTMSPAIVEPSPEMAYGEFEMGMPGKAPKSLRPVPSVQLNPASRPWLGNDLPAAVRPSADRADDREPAEPAGLPTRLNDGVCAAAVIGRYDQEPQTIKRGPMQGFHTRNLTHNPASATNPRLPQPASAVFPPPTP